MTTLHVVATIPLDPTHAAEAAPVLAELAAASRNDAGCLVYEAYESASTPGVFVTVEEWSDPSDLDKHMQTEHIKGALGVLGSELAEAPAIHPLKPLDVQ